VLGAGPMAAYIAYLLVKNDPARHYWIVVISTGELYGGLDIAYYEIVHYDVHVSF
jgi:EXPERA (EXPanded EBP superfamily)